MNFYSYEIYSVSVLNFLEFILVNLNFYIIKKDSDSFNYNFEDINNFDFSE